MQRRTLQPTTWLLNTLARRSDNRLLIWGRGDTWRAGLEAVIFSVLTKTRLLMPQSVAVSQDSSIIAVRQIAQPRSSGWMGARELSFMRCETYTKVSSSHTKLIPWRMRQNANYHLQMRNWPMTINSKENGTVMIGFPVYADPLAVKGSWTNIFFLLQHVSRDLSAKSWHFDASNRRCALVDSVDFLWAQNSSCGQCSTTLLGVMESCYVCRMYVLFVYYLFIWRGHCPLFLSLYVVWPYSVKLYFRLPDRRRALYKLFFLSRVHYKSHDGFLYSLSRYTNE